jgi:hypothetical protein
MRGAATVVRPATPDDHRSIATLLDRVLGQRPYPQRERVWEWRRQCARYLNWRYRSLPSVRTHAVALHWGTEDAWI